MGYSSSSDDDSRRIRKKKKKHSRSPSYASESSYSSRSKKSHSKHHARSRSRSAERLRRSRSRDRRSRDRGRRSRSPTRKSRRSKSRSRSRERSRERKRYLPSRSSSRSPGRRKRRSRSSSRPRHRSPADRNTTRNGSAKTKEIQHVDPAVAASQVQAKMELALRAVALTDEKLKSNNPGIDDTIKDRREEALAIDQDGFTPATFVSNRQQKQQTAAISANSTLSHDEAIFGQESALLSTCSLPMVDPNSIMHPNLYIPAEEKMKRWVNKLMVMRKKALDGR